MFSNKPGSKPHSTEKTSQDSQGGLTNAAARPWEEVTLSPQQRYDSYRELVEEKCRRIVLAMSRPEITTEEKTAIRLDIDTQFWHGQLEQLRNENPQEFCERVDRELNKKTEGYLTKIDGCRAVVGYIAVDGKRLETLLSEGSFDGPRSGQEQYAKSLGFRIATREENLAYAEGLILKEEAGIINKAEANALKTYRERFVRDIEGSLSVVSHRLNDEPNFIEDHPVDWYDGADPEHGALFVRDSPRLKSFGR
jgi:hypothetical protein